MAKKNIVNPSRALSVLTLIFLVLGVAFSAQSAFANKASAPTTQSSSLHPPIIFVDSDGVNVLESGEPVSTMKTCGECHDTDFIQEHSYHANMGLNELTNAGNTPSERAWDTSPGFFGKWNPLTYRYLSPPGDERIDLTTAGWVQFYGARHTGGGPAVYARDGETLLTDLKVSANNPETSIVDPESGKLVEWDWNESGIVEMNCFLCHISNPDNDARMEALHTG
jgi:hypothetical protein